MNLGRMVCLALMLGPQLCQAQQQNAAPLPFLLASQGGQPQEIAQVFVSHLSEIKQKTKVPVLLPSDLPQPIAKAKYSAVGDLQADKYEIGLYYELGAGDAGSAAFFKGQTKPKYEPKVLPNAKKVKLVRGTWGYFREVSCGGSCAPANLWWIYGGSLYQIQLELQSTMSESEPENKIVAVANSAIAAGPR